VLGIDLRGKRALVAGVADDAGFGFAIARKLAEAGASICTGTWPPAYGIFTKMLARGKIDLALPSGGKLAFERIYPLDVEYDALDAVPSEVRESRRYKPHGDFTVGGLAERLRGDFGDRPLDILVHAVANAPEVRRPLLETTREGYLAALGASSYSFVALLRRLGPLLRPGGACLCLTYIASQRVIPGYGGGMSSAKAALEADTRVLAYEAGRRFGARVNCISAGPWPSRAASAIGFIETMIEYARRNAPLPEALHAEEVAAAAAFLLSPLASGITGSVVYVDKGLHAMGIPPEAIPETAPEERIAGAAEDPDEPTR
jgi:enoyl-[acyl-carrier protein] reductase I